jgi:hypothetical protein
VPDARRLGIWDDELGENGGLTLKWADHKLQVPPKKGEKDHDSV